MAEASDNTLILVSCPSEHENAGSDMSEQSESDLEESSDSDSDGQGELDETLSFITSLSSHHTPEASPTKTTRIDPEQEG